MRKMSIVDIVHLLTYVTQQASYRNRCTWQHS